MTGAFGAMLNSQQACAYLGISPRKLAAMCERRRREITFYKPGRERRFRVADLDAWLESKCIPAIAARGKK